MSSTKQVLANRANAQNSTGPRTEAGKLATRFNAAKHGLTGQVVLRTPEEQAAYASLTAQLIPDLAPANAIEQSFAVRIVCDTWRLEQAAAIEQNMLALPDPALDAVDDPALASAAAYELRDKAFARMSLYMQRIQRSLHKDLDMLRKVQKERRAEALLAMKAAAAQPSRRPVQAAENAAPSPANGFVLSTPEAHPAPPPDVAPNAPENMAA